MTLQHTLKNLVDNLEGGLACSVVDLKTGAVLSIYHQSTYFLPSMIDTVTAAAIEIFRGKNITLLEKMLAHHRGDKPSYHKHEIQITSKRTYHFMSVIPNKPDTLVILVTSTRTNFGMGWAGLRMAIPTIEQEVRALAII